MIWVVLSRMGSYLIAPENTLGLLFVLFLAVAIGIVGERKGWYGRISGIMITILVGVALVTAGIMPPAGNSEVPVPVYNWIFAFIVPFSIPLFLFNANLGRIIRETGRLSLFFLLGAFGIMVGAAVATFFVPLGPEAYKLAGVFTATYTGGSANFLAVADSFQFLESPLFQAAVAVDVAFTSFILLLLFYLPGWKPIQRFFPHRGTIAKPKPPQKMPITLPLEHRVEGMNLEVMEQLALCLLITTGITWLGAVTATPLESILRTDIKLDILLITVYILVAVNLFPSFFSRLEDIALQLGYLLAFLFLAVIGIASDLKEILVTTPWMLLFVLITLLVHLIIVLLGGWLMKASLEELAIASAANVGGSTISAPMAVSFGLPQLVTAAVLIGTLGSALGTFLGVSIGLILR